MGWLRTIFLGDVGNRLDIADNEDRIRRMRREQRRRDRSKRERDASQDEQIASVREDVDELQVALGTMARILVGKGALTHTEMTRLVEAIESKEPPPDDS